LNLLDENFPADQAALLREWKLPHRQIGRDLSCLGVQDADIIPLLHRHKRVTLFTQDEDFFKPRLCHPAYCLVWLDVKPGEAAFYLRRFLRHHDFNTHAERMGLVARASREGVHLWRRGQTRKIFVRWPE
jgi:hypothetical protein